MGKDCVLTSDIEIGVVGQIARTILICRSVIFNGNLVGIRQRKPNGHLHISRIPALTVGGEMGEFQSISHDFRVPNFTVEIACKTAVERVCFFVGFHVVSFAVNRER